MLFLNSDFPVGVFGFCRHQHTLRLIVALFRMHDAKAESFLPYVPRETAEGGETCANKTDVSGNEEKQEQTEWEGVTGGLKRGTRGHGENDGATRASWGKLRDGSFSG